MTEQPKKDLDHLFYGESISGRPFLSLKCNRDDCWLKDRQVAQWHDGNIDYAEVSAAVFAHQFQHLGQAIRNIFKVIQ